VENRNLNIFHSIILQREVFYKSNCFLQEWNRDLATNGLSGKLRLGSYIIVSGQVTCRVSEDRKAFGAYDECAVVLRFEMINGSINVYRDRKYKQGQKDKQSLKKNK
jgi:hypothetical protein